MGRFSKANEAPDSVKEQWEMDRQARVEKRELEQYLHDSAAKSARLTREHNAPQVWWNR